jgi:hypothetical protein
LGAALDSSRDGEAWQHVTANSTATALSFVVPAKAKTHLSASGRFLNSHKHRTAPETALLCTDVDSGLRRDDHKRAEL